MPPRASPSASARGKSRKKKRAVESEIGDLVLESDSEARPKKRKRKPNERKRKKEELEHSSVWFKKAIATDLWMPEKMDLETVDKPVRARKPHRARRKPRKHWDKGKPGVYWGRPKRGRSRHHSKYVRERVPTAQRSIEPLLTSWFEVENFTDEHRSKSWRTSSMPKAPIARKIVDELRDLGVLWEPADPVNSVIKVPPNLRKRS